LPALGHLPLSSVTRDEVKKFVGGLRKKTVQRAKSDREPARLLSKESIRNIVAALRACFSEAGESDLVAANPACRLGKFYKEAADYREEIDPFLSQEIPTMLQTTRDHFGFENYVLMLTLFHTGVRPGEACGLYWSDLDVKNRVLVVRRQYTRGRKGKPKTRKRRSVDISSVLLAELLKLKKQRQGRVSRDGKE